MSEAVARIEARWFFWATFAASRFHKHSVMFAWTAATIAAGTSLTGQS